MKALIATCCLCLPFSALAMENIPSINHSVTNNSISYSNPSASINKALHFYLGGEVDFSQFKFENHNPSITYYNGFLNDAYPSQNNHSRFASASIQGGYELLPSKKYFPALALGLGVYFMPSEYSNSGQLIETPLDDAPTILNNYQYSLDTTRFMLEAKSTWNIKHLKPFINLGVGFASTRLDNYQETPISANAYNPYPPFQDKTNRHFAYQFGLGIGYEFNFIQESSEFMHEQVSLGYRYVSLGKTSFGTRGSLYPYKLVFGKTNSQDLYLSYIHSF